MPDKDTTTTTKPRVQTDEDVDLVVVVVVVVVVVAAVVAVVVAKNRQSREELRTPGHDAYRDVVQQAATSGQYGSLPQGRSEQPYQRLARTSWPAVDKEDLVRASYGNLVADDRKRLDEAFVVLLDKVDAQTVNRRAKIFENQAEHTRVAKGKSFVQLMSNKKYSFEIATSGNPERQLEDIVPALVNRLQWTDEEEARNAVKVIAPAIESNLNKFGETESAIIPCCVASDAGSYIALKMAFASINVASTDEGRSFSVDVSNVVFHIQRDRNP